MTFAPGKRFERRVESVRAAERVAFESSAGSVPSPDAPRRRLTEAEETAALAMLVLVLLTGATAPELLDDDEHDLEAAVWRAAGERRHEDDPQLWLARVGYLRDGYRRDRTRRLRLADRRSA